MSRDDVIFLLPLLMLGAAAAVQTTAAPVRPRARDIGIAPGAGHPAR